MNKSRRRIVRIFFVCWSSRQNETAKLVNGLIECVARKQSDDFAERLRPEPSAMGNSGWTGFGMSVRIHHRPMQTSDLAVAADQIIAEMERLIPVYLANPEDRQIANGNMAICIIDHSGRIHGRIFGTNQIRGRESFKVAWIKASQTWITGMKTGEYEKAVFSETIDEGKFGIGRPDFIGWEGGQPIKLKDGTILFVGVSGIRGIYDLEIAVRAVAAAGL